MPASELSPRLRLVKDEAPRFTTEDIAATDALLTHMACLLDTNDHGADVVSGASEPGESRSGPRRAAPAGASLNPILQRLDAQDYICCDVLTAHHYLSERETRLLPPAAPTLAQMAEPSVQKRFTCWIPPLWMLANRHQLVENLRSQLLGGNPRVSYYDIYDELEDRPDILHSVRGRVTCQADPAWCNCYLVAMYRASRLRSSERCRRGTRSSYFPKERGALLGA